jgi:hydroxyacid-oxoacid transhydrogenase
MARSANWRPAGKLVPGTMKQQRLLATCPRPVNEEDIAGIFARSIENW